MSSVFNSGPFRSRSSSNIPDLAKVPPKVLKPSNKDELPRSASFTYIPNAGGQYLENGRQAPDTSDERGVTMQMADAREGRKPSRLTKEDRPRLDSVGRRKSLVARPKSWIQKVKGSPERADESEQANTTSADASPLRPIPKPTKEDRRKSVSGSFANFARKSWMTSSRSPSPSRTHSNPGSRKQSVDQANKITPLENEGGASRLAQPLPSNASGSPQKPTLARQSTLQKIKHRPQSVLMTLTNLASANSSTSSLPSSTDNKSTPRTSIDKVPPVPKTFSTEKLLMGLDGHRRRDELWSAFRSLDNDFSKFQAKSWTLKTNIVRSSLLPFLKNHAAHPSSESLRPEDLERRVTVLNKWWNGLLEVLDGRQNQVVSGVDRPILLEACYCIMIRPEWRAAPSQFAPLSKRSSRSPARTTLSSKKSSASMRSTTSQFFADSVYHNTKTQFIQNLLTQVTYVVDKMSLRHAPASLVTFCGKAVAYAFFFVPGIADVLVRVWNLSAENLRRVADELGLPTRANRQETEDAFAAFPEHLRSLGWSSPKAMVSLLRRNAMLSIMAAKVNWYGPWSARWCGRDSDLFFVFVKHYFILTEEYMTSDLPLVSKCRAPGFILVQAQLLSVLDGTIKRTPQLDALPITFDDFLAGADASAAPLLPSSNSSRPMAENRLIMLLRDFLSDHSSDFVSARTTFAEVFSKLLQTSAHKTSLYDHLACLVLCDFMEEALAIFVRFHDAHTEENDHIDWYFWLDACKKILQSQNSMSEIRLFSFIYGSWNLITSDICRKEVVALQWLLTEETFTKYFCHWCPMVRAYFMRLLCWRLCRDDGEASELDTKIFSTLSIRLKSVFAHYLFLKQRAETSRTIPPSTVPSHPAPGRRFLIIRNDNQAPTANIFLSFDGIMPSAHPSSTPSTQFKRHSTQTTPPAPESTSDQLTPKDTKKRWSLLGKSFSPFEVQPPSTFPTVTPSPSPPRNLDDARREIASARTIRPSFSTAVPAGSKSGTEAPASYRAYSFKFSLEWSQNFERNVKKGNLERRIVSPRLPNPAQACVSARVPGTGMETLPRDPGTTTEGVKYAGRALAEWAVIVGECNSFVERRRMEGVPGLRWVEVPVLGVEGFRKFGG